MMKCYYSVPFLALSALLVSSCASQDSNAEQRAIGLQRGCLVTGVGALQDLRQGKTSEAIKTLESHTYSTAVILLESPVWQTNSTVQTFVVELEKYRRQHAQSESKWTPTEKRLEQLLKSFKKDKKTNQ